MPMRCQAPGVLLLFAAALPASAQRIPAIDSAIRAGIHTGIYPGAVVVVGRADTILYSRGYGHFTWDSRSDVPDPQTTRWDLASLTKVVATTSAIAVLVQHHKVDLDAPVARYLPAFHGGRKDQVTVRMLLNHTSGMPPYEKFWQTAHSPDQARQELLATPLARQPGQSAVYSDLNGMLAGLVVEHTSGLPLDAFVTTAVFRPLGMLDTRYRVPAADRATAAPTGRFHGVPVAGQVNDQNAVVFGGISGHAGLFSTGLDLARFAQGWLRAAAGKGNWLHRGTVEDFFVHTPASGTRVLGWDTPIPPGSGKLSLYGKCSTESTYGH
ncbi:MAG: serine hydrolase domain-containing protein, partial [Gemmatimonadales bacterium]